MNFIRFIRTKIPVNFVPTSVLTKLHMETPIVKSKNCNFIKNES